MKEHRIWFSKNSTLVKTRFTLLHKTRISPAGHTWLYSTLRASGLCQIAPICPPNPQPLPFTMRSAWGGQPIWRAGGPSPSSQAWPERGPDGEDASSLWGLLELAVSLHSPKVVLGMWFSHIPVTTPPVSQWAKGWAALFHELWLLHCSMGLSNSPPTPLKTISYSPFPEHSDWKCQWFSGGTLMDTGLLQDKSCMAHVRAKEGSPGSLWSHGMSHAPVRQCPTSGSSLFSCLHPTLSPTLARLLFPNIIKKSVWKWTIQVLAPKGKIYYYTCFRRTWKRSNPRRGILL